MGLKRLFGAENKREILNMQLRKSILAMIVFFSILITSVRPSFADWADVIDEFIPTVNISPQANNASFSGASSDSIPIVVPPGRNGIEPSLSLFYNSYAKNGWVGVGWSLEMGSIQRSTKNGISYSSAEFIVTFNGSTSELVKIDDNGNYRAKIEGAFTNYHLDSSGKWLATTRDGTEYSYGTDETSRQDNPSNSNQIFKWYLDRVEDTNGNYMTISYDEYDENDIYPYEIEYTGNGSALPSYFVRFYLEDRVDLVPSYTSQYKVINTKRLKTIEVLYDDMPVRAYLFEYKDGDSVDSKRSLLEKIRQYGSDVVVNSSGAVTSDTSLPVTTLTYTQYETGSFNFVGQSLNPHSNLIQTELADFNGDGKTDFLEMEFVNSTTEDNNFYIHFSNGDGTFDTELIDILPSGYDGVWFAVPGDFNGDGMADLIVGYYGGLPFHTYLSNGDGTFTDVGEVYDYTGEGGGRCITPVDFNGDGKTDFLINKSSPPDPPTNKNASWYAYLSDGDGTFTSKGHIVTNTEWENFIVPGDFNGDGKTDFLVNTNAASNAWQVYLGYGEDGDFSYAGAIPSSTADWRAPTLGDFNGDGLTDIIIDNGSAWYVYLSKGDGTFIFINGLAYSDDSDSISAGDFNGDGFTDTIIHSAVYNYNGWYVCLSDGDGTFRNTSTLSSFTSYSLSPLSGDFDGDGKADILLLKRWAGIGTIAELYVCFADTEAEISPDLLTTVSNGSGGVKTYAYKLSSEYDNYLMPFVLQTLFSININNGFGGSYTTQYSYSGGLFSYDTREFRGFQTSEKENPDGSKVKTTYHQGEYLKGRPQREDYYNTNGYYYGHTQYAWDDSEEVAAGSFFVQLTGKTTSYPYDVVETTEAYIYNLTHGGLESKTISGNNADPVTTETDWENVGDWIWRVEEERLMDNESTGWLRKTHYEYYPAGNVSEKYYYLIDPVTQLETYTKETFTYDDYGNPTGGLQPRTTDVYPNGIPKPTVLYEEDTHTYPETITNVLGHVVEMTYDYKFGKVSGIKNPNNHWTHYVYDEFGDVTREYTVDGDTQETVADKNTVHYRNTAHRYVVNQVKESVNSTIDSYTYVDGLGRIILIAAKGEDEGQAVVTYKYYDNMNRNYRTDGPYFVEGVSFPLSSSSYSSLLPPSGNYSHSWVKTIYDERGRPEYVQNPDASGDDRTGRIAQVAYSYNGLATTITDADDKSRTEVKDFLGRVVEVIEHADTDQVTQYEYNAAGNLRKVIDAIGNETEITYDQLGRKITMDDPDMGVWRYTYDANGNLKTQTDAKGQIIEFTYDALDRIKLKNYTNTTDPDVYYDYDIPSTLNGIGQLCLVSKKDDTPAAVPVAETEYEEYDALGQAKLVTKSIQNSSGSLLSYSTSYEYDMSGKTTQITYPDDTDVKYTYYLGTDLLHQVYLPNALGEFVEHAEFSAYEPSGKIGRIDYWENSVYTDYFYDQSSGRLIDISTSNGQITIQGKSYGYSKAGDIETITDNKLETTHTYEYDNLHRLINETSSVDVNDFPLKIIYPVYPEPGDGLPVHAVSSVFMNGSSYAYEYDDNGNMEEGWDFTDPTSPATRTFQYNADNMPTQITHQANGVINYVYDGEGRRVKKVVDGVDKVYYVGEHYEVRDGDDPVKYIFAGNIRLAMVDSSGIYYYHKDHLGSTAGMTSSDSSAIQAGSEADYLPYGGERTSSSVTLTSYAFTDQERDAESGLYNYNARLYDPIIGRFITPDTEVPDPYDPQSLNRYTYCLNNPLIYTDPTGHYMSYDEYMSTQGTTTVTYDENTGEWVATYTQPTDAQYNGYVLDQMAQESALQSVLNWAQGGLDAVGIFDPSPISDGTNAIISAARGNYTDAGLSLIACVPYIGDAVGKGGKYGGKAFKALSNGAALKSAGKLSANSLKEFKQLVNQLSKPGSKLTQQEFSDLKKLVEQYGGRIRADLNGVKGSGVDPHVHIEGLGKSIESRHIWIEGGVK
jgi:RHS repeat-associated protein